MSFKRQFHLKPGEKIHLELRRHPITFLRHIVLTILAVVVPMVGAGLFFDGVPTFENAWARLGFVLLGSIYYLSVWLFFFTQFVDFFLDISIVTDRRIIDVHQTGLFNRSVSELDLARVQDVTSEVNGAIGTILDFGRVNVQTAGEQEHFVFESIPHPHRVRQIVLELAHSDREREGKQIVADAIGQGE